MKNNYKIISVFVCIIIALSGALAYQYNVNKKAIKSCNYNNDDLHENITDLEKEKEEISKKYNALVSEHKMVKRDYEELESKFSDIEHELNMCKKYGS